MSMDIFSENPRFFSLDRNSLLASKLKASISHKLVSFLGNHTDDVLSEYIVVLVCNGKHQNQARDHLEAFLGNRSGEFVSWLWDLLTVTADQLHMTVGSSNLKDVIVTSCTDAHVENYHEPFRSTGISNHAREDSIMVSKEEYYPMPYNPMVACSTEVHSRQDFDASGDEATENEVFKACKHDIPVRPRSTDDNCNGILNFRSSRVIPFEIPASPEQSMQHVNQHRKMINDVCPGFPRQGLQPPKREPTPRNAQSLPRENLNLRPYPVFGNARKRFSWRAANFVANQDAPPRRTVWDRLGRPREEEANARNKKFEFHGAATLKGRLVEHLVQGPDHNRRQQHGINRKRQFSDFAPRLANASIGLGDNEGRRQQKEIRNHLQGPSAKYSRTQSLNSLVSGTRKTGEVLTCRPRDNAPNLSANKVSQTKLAENNYEETPTQADVSSALVTEPDSVSSEDHQNTSLTPVEAEVLDMKLKLRQLEMEMSELRSKRISDEKPSSLTSSWMETSGLRSKQTSDDKPSSLTSSSTSNPSEEDVESRTVFVTNVHFAAPIEALSLHFTKCGGVVRTIILNDALTAQPKGAAYITFTSKDSAEKALSLSGTSFMSRTLKRIYGPCGDGASLIRIVRKTEMPVETAQAHAAGNLSWPQVTQPNKAQKSNSSTHLQWRRDQSTGTDNSISVE